MTEPSVDKAAPAAGHNKKRSFQVDALPDQDVVDKVDNFASSDVDQDKTWTRLVVEKVLSKSSWYNPQGSDPDAPSLLKAYAYYEHVTLPRYFRGDPFQRKAEPGEDSSPTDLYNPFTTPASVLREWGVGVDTYFSTLGLVATLMFLVGLINIPDILYYASADYSANGQIPGETVSSWTLWGSAVCTTYEWVACPNCTRAQFPDYNEEDEVVRFGLSAEGVPLVLRNQCGGADWHEAGSAFWTFVVLCYGVSFLSKYLRAREIRADEDKLTATDYSVVVFNPPPKAYDPDEWKTYFEQFAKKQVTAVTVALNNDVLLQKLVERRVLRNNLRLLLPKDTDMDNPESLEAAIDHYLEKHQFKNPTWWTRNCRGEAPVLTLRNKIATVTEEIKELQTKEYKVSRVFVTFETEEGQRNALQKLSVGAFAVWMNSPKTPYRFQDRVLWVDEPKEPDTIRWLDQETTLLGRTVKQFVTLLITLVCLAVSSVVVYKTREEFGPYMAANVVTVSNSVIPEVIAYLMANEAHLNEGTYQVSLYLKITIFRWINTTILARVITPSTGTLMGGPSDLLPSIDALFWSYLTVSPVLALMDISSNVYKHYFAPRAETQELMNLNFKGTAYNLGVLYTELSTIVFLTLFYGSIYPIGFFFGATILMVQYYVYKFCLMRLWARAATLGSQLARFSRRYFLNGSVLAFLISTAYIFAKFPYDDLCDPVVSDGVNYTGTYTNVDFFNGDILEEVVVTQEREVRYCTQSWSDTGAFPFPPSTRFEDPMLTFMTEDQRVITGSFSFLMVLVLCIFVLLFFINEILHPFLSLFKGTYEASGMVQHVDFSSVDEIFGYVPQLTVANFSFPLLGCDVDDIYEGLIGWSDKHHSFDYHNLIYDVPYPGMKRRARKEGATKESSAPAEEADVNGNEEGAAEASAEPAGATEQTSLLEQSSPIFSIVRHYPPEWLQNILNPPEPEPTVDDEAVAEGEEEEEPEAEETAEAEETKANPFLTMLGVAHIISPTSSKEE